MNPRLVSAMLFAGFAISAAAAADDAPDAVTYSKDVAPLLQKHCQTCHRPGELAPMSFLSHAETRPWAKAIKKQVAEREMPPWHADPQYGTFSNDTSLTEAEIATFVRWADQGAPEGDPKDLPPPVQWEHKEWLLGTPDIVLKADRPVPVPATGEGEDLYHCVVLPLNQEKDVWVDAFEYKVGNPRVVHHLVGFQDTTGKAAARDALTPEPGFPCAMGGGGGAVSSVDGLLGGWGPGTPPNVNHPGTAKLLRKDAAIMLQIHYTNPTGVPQFDQSAVGLRLARNPVKAQSRAAPVAVSPMRFVIKAGDPAARQMARWAPREDIYIYSLSPHMHLLGKSMTFTAEYPDGREEILLSVPRFNFNWQTTYRLAEPKFVPNGAKIRIDSVHDNSKNNPNNPRPQPVDMKWGESTTEEMAIGFVGYWKASEDLNVVQEIPPEAAAPASPRL